MPNRTPNNRTWVVSKPMGFKELVPQLPLKMCIRFPCFFVQFQKFSFNNILSEVCPSYLRTRVFVFLNLDNPVASNVLNPAVEDRMSEIIIANYGHRNVMLLFTQSVLGNCCSYDHRCSNVVLIIVNCTSVF